MDICSNRHSEIVYTAICCPLCHTIEENTELQEELDARFEELYYDLFHEVRKHAPELAI